MKATQQLHALGQSVWLDNITRGLLTSGGLQAYINGFSVTGLTSNPTIFDEAIKGTDFYDAAIHEKAATGKSDEQVFFELALEDLTEAARLFRPVYQDSSGVDGWVSLEVSPLLADDSAATVKAALQLHNRAHCPNVFIKIPGTEAGISAIEEAIFQGVPVNVTLLFSQAQYLAAAEAYMRGIERRLVAGLDPSIASVASVFVSRWDVSVNDKVPNELQNCLGIAIAKQTYQAYSGVRASSRWQKLSNAGAHPQRLLWASTGTKDPRAPDTLYVEALAAPDTINTMPEKTLHAFADHGAVRGSLTRDGGDSDRVLEQFSRLGVDIAALGARLQREGAQSFDRSWIELLQSIRTKSTTRKAQGQAGNQSP